jgi:hypothetical protein
MLIFTPKSGRLIALDGVVDQQLADLHQCALSEAMDRGARDVLINILQNCTKVTEANERGWRVKRFSIRALVIDEEDYRNELEDAYRNGLRDGRSPTAIWSGK